jgi:phosphoserine phosphatase RsbU/P
LAQNRKIQYKKYLALAVMVVQVKKKNQPAIELMNRLRYPQKFLLISLVFSLPLMLITYLLMSEISSRIEFTQMEIHGNRYLRLVEKVWEEALKGQVSVAVSTIEAEKLVNLDGIKQPFNQLRQEEELAKKFDTTEKITQLQGTISTLSIKDNRQNGFIYSSIVERLKSLRTLVGDNSNLILDPDLDSYYLMDASLLKLSAIQQLLTEIQLYKLAIVSGQKITPNQRERLNQLFALLKNQVEDIKVGINTSFKQTPALKERLEQPFNSLLLDTQKVITELDSISDSQAYVLPKQDLAQSVRDRSFQFSAQVTDRLDDLLQKRIDGFAQRRLWVLVFIGLVLVSVVYLFNAFYRSVMQTVNELEQVARLMSVGQLDCEFKVETKDELGMVVHAFNRVARALQRTEEKYRSIFENSVEGIFQSTPDGQYLSANNALAKIYGYGNAEELVDNLTEINQLYVQGDRRDDFVELIQAYDRVTEFESEVYQRDRTVIWISESARAVRDPNGEILYYEGVVQDISDRKRAEEDLAQANVKIVGLAKKLQKENLRMSSELEVTRRLQSLILPKLEELNNLDGIEVAGFMEPANEVGGDYYDVLQHNGKIKIAIGDVTGHGLESGLLMVMVQAAVRTLMVSDQTNAVTFMDVLNRTVYGNVQRMQSDKNLSLALIDYADGKLFLSGQHEVVILVRAGGVIERIDTIDLGFPIGLEEDISRFVHHVQIDLKSGDGIVLYTDGITEAENYKAELYGLNRLCEVVSANWQTSADSIKLAVIEDLRSHIGNHRIYDDITLVVLKQN